MNDYNRIDEKFQERREVFACDGRPCGKIRDGVYSKKVNINKHLFFKLNAWGIDTIAFDEIIRLMCHTLKLYEETEKTWYEVSVENFQKYCVRNIRPFHGYGKQYFLPLSYWEKSSGDDTQPDLFAVAGVGR